MCRFLSSSLELRSACLFTSLFILLTVPGSSLTSSQISSTLGLAHILKDGVGRVMGNGGGCNGLCSGQFILVFFACLSEKNLWLNWIILIFLQGYSTKIQTGFLITSIFSIQLSFSLFCTIGYGVNNLQKPS